MVNESSFSGALKEAMVFRIFKATREDKVLKLGNFPPMPVSVKVECPVSADDVHAFVESMASKVEEARALDIARLQVSVCFVCVCVCLFCVCVCVCVCVRARE